MGPLGVAVLLDTPDLVVLHKHHGVPFHSRAAAPGAAAPRAGVLELVRQQVAEGALPALAGCPRLWPVHRLDTITSGALVLAKTREAAGELIGAFRERRVTKYYVALSDRPPSRKQGTVAGGMARGRRGSWMLTRRGAAGEGGAAPAVTRFASVALRGEASELARPGLRAFLLKPETGRTHQLRVALKSLGAPVLGDARYATAAAAAAEVRGHLHAAALRFVLGGAPVQVVCRPEGGEFGSAAFGRAFDAWFPAGLEGDCGEWFGDSKLMRSSLLGRGAVSQ